MALTIDADYVIRGGERDALSPSFRYGEFRSAAGHDAPRVHLDLVSGLQALRDVHGSALRIRGTNPAGAPGDAVEGLFAWVSGSPMDALTVAASKLVSQGLLADAHRAGQRLYVSVRPGAAPPVPVDAALDVAVWVTAGFETAGDPYQQVTGNFDGAGLSFGPAQINFGTGTLPPVFEAMRTADEAALRDCFGARYQEWLDVLALPSRQQVAWADARSTGPRKAGFVQPWRGCLQAVGRVPLFRSILVESAKAKYGEKMRRAIDQLEALAPGITIDRLRCFAALYDLCTQQGSLDKALGEIEKRVAAERPEDQRDLVRIAVTERGATARRPYRADCISRRLSILDRVPVRVQHSGETARRVNRHLWRIRGVRVEGGAAL